MVQTSGDQLSWTLSNLSGGGPNLTGVGSSRSQQGFGRALGDQVPSQLNGGTYNLTVMGADSCTLVLSTRGEPVLRWSGTANIRGLAGTFTGDWS